MTNQGGFNMKITEGYMPFEGFQTYYRVVGECKEGKKPLVLLHGGPGSTHNYFEVLDKIAETGRQVIMYDQIGCGNSFVEGHPELFNADTWIKELMKFIYWDNLGVECRLFGMLQNINQKELNLIYYHPHYLLQNYGKKSKKEEYLI